MELLVGVLAILIGLLSCFAGYRIFVLLLPVWGFVVGFLTDDIKGLRMRLLENGFEPGEYHDIPRGVVMDVYDPDDNRLQATQLDVKAADLR